MNQILYGDEDNYYKDTGSCKEEQKCKWNADIAVNIVVTDTTSYVIIIIYVASNVTIKLYCQTE